MEIQRQFTAFGLVIGTSATLLAGTDHPLPSPTPRPGTLAAIAAERTLTRTDGSDPIVITDDNLDSLGRNAAFAIAGSPPGNFSAPPSDDVTDSKTRAVWRRKVMAQSQAIARLETKRRGIEEEINRLERGRLDARALDRIAKAEAKLAAVDVEIQREQVELSRIIRAARQDGAQPGWFR